MESSSSTQMQQHQDPNTQNPNPSYHHQPQPLTHILQPPGTDPYPPPATHYQQLADGSWVPSSYSYYHDPNVLVSNETNLAVNPLAQGVSMGAYPINPPPQNVSKQKVAKKQKVVQSVWCEICNIECNTKDVFEVHKTGKKHNKNLLKLTGAPSNVPASTPTPVSAPIVIIGPSPASAPSATPSTSLSVIIGPQENPNASSKTSAKKKRKNGGIKEDLATKTRKVLEGGAAAAEVRTCPVCNVVCNSDTVYIFHLAGQKHAAMMRKNAVPTGGAVVT